MNKKPLSFFNIILFIGFSYTVGIMGGVLAFYLKLLEDGFNIPLAYVLNFGLAITSFYGLFVIMLIIKDRFINI